MNSTVSALPSARRRRTPIIAGVLALLGSFVVVAPAHAGYYEDSYYGSNPCSYRCGYPAYRYYPAYRHRHHYGPHLVYERRYIERQYVERRYGYSNYRRHYGCYSYGGCRPRYGYYSDGGYRPQPRSYGYGYGYGDGYGGVGRRWPAPYLDGSYGDGYEPPPRPPAPVLDEGEY